MFRTGNPALNLRRLLFILLAFGLAVAGQVAGQEAPLNVVATTMLIADVAHHVAGELATVTSLLPPDADTHSYQPTPQDIARVADADLLLVNGAGYETFLGGLLENAGDVQTVVVSNGVAILGLGDDHDHDGHEAHIGILGDDLTCEAGDHAHEAEVEHDEAEHDDHEHGACDPHVWTNPANVMIWARNIADALAAADPTNADTYQANADAYIAQLEALDADLRALLDIVPPERRVLVTNHEFLGYFADAYGFEVAATVLPGVSTRAEPNPQALTALIEQLEALHVPAIFAEVSASSQLAQIVAEEAGINVVTTLYSESLSSAGGLAATYIDSMRTNAQAIADALIGE